MTEIVFLVEEDPEGGYTARALGESIFTQAPDLANLREMVRDAVRCHFPDEKARPKAIRLHLVRDEVIAAGSCPGTCPGASWPLRWFAWATRSTTRQAATSGSPRNTAESTT